jgi:hypothetical protein
MGQYIKELGFYFDSEDQEAKKEKYYINDLLTSDPIDFKGSGKLFLFFPFKSYTRPPNKGEKPIYGPAVGAIEYSFVPDKDGFPVFKRKTHFASLLQKNIILKK